MRHQPLWRLTVVVVGQSVAAPAAAHNDKCTKQLCLWFSSGAASGIYQSNEELVWSNFIILRLAVSERLHLRPFHQRQRSQRRGPK